MKAYVWKKLYSGNFFKEISVKLVPLSTDKMVMRKYWVQILEIKARCYR